MNLNKAQATGAAQALVLSGLVSKVGSNSDKCGVILTPAANSETR